jgi:hypothetical protein
MSTSFSRYSEASSSISCASDSSSSEESDGKAVTSNYFPSDMILGFINNIAKDQKSK